MRALVFLLVLAGVPRLPLAAAPPQAAKLVPDSPAYQEFKRLVQEYVKQQRPATHCLMHRVRSKSEAWTPHGHHVSIFSTAPAPFAHILPTASKKPGPTARAANTVTA